MTPIPISEALTLPVDAPPIMREVYEEREQQWIGDRVAEFRTKLDDLDVEYETIQIRPTSLWSRLVERLQR